MSRLHDRIPEDKAQEVFTLAAQLYAQHNQSYSVQELMEAGAEAKIPPEFVQEAIDQLQITPVQKSALSERTQRSKGYLAALAIGLPLLAAIAAAWWLVARNAATSAQVQESPAPTSNQNPLSDANVGKGNFKCARLNLKGQDLRSRNLGSDCTEAQLESAILSDLNLEGINLSRAKLNDAKLNGANLKGADLTGANLAGADLSGANLEGANLSNTDLRGADLTDANTNGTDMAGAKLDGAKLNGAK